MLNFRPIFCFAQVSGFLYVAFNLVREHHWVFSPLVYISTVFEKNEAKISKLSVKFDIKTVTLYQSFN